MGPCSKLATPSTTSSKQLESFINEQHLIVTMTDKLPPNLLALFAPRPPLRWVPPADHAPGERRTAEITGLAAFLPALQEYKEKDVYVPTESWLQRKDRIRLEKKERQERLLKEGPVLCEGDPICFDCLFLPLCPNSWTAVCCDIQLTLSSSRQAIRGP